ncbi:hypothetical protein [Lentilactobacillus laojiaonis]|uniref:hypothetical protein n=1 Tax=Lentilactobacillus laojiaonis TaxID=2883998 RepID=UPI001D0B6915|nr:hypothetical protein [Lentilactobacillus laojiaonis]UDM32426.1 hypothetical protein LHL71_01450 [Lentilactobacillus laojiaonis]
MQAEPNKLSNQIDINQPKYYQEYNSRSQSLNTIDAASGKIVHSTKSAGPFKNIREK